MKIKRLSYIILIAMTIFTTTSLYSLDDPEVLWENLRALREDKGLVTLEKDLQLEVTAQKYAQELAEKGVLSHRDSFGRTAADRFAWTGRLVTLGEILGAGENLGDLVPAWLASVGHRKILLGNQWTSWGWGVAKKGKVWVVVVLFLRP